MLTQVPQSINQSINQSKVSDFNQAVFMCPDVGALSQLVMSTLDQNSGVTLPPLQDAAEPTEEGTDTHFSLSPDSPVSLILICIGSSFKSSHHQRRKPVHYSVGFLGESRGK